MYFISKTGRIHLYLKKKESSAQAVTEHKLDDLICNTKKRHTYTDTQMSMVDLV